MAIHPRPLNVLRSLFDGEGALPLVQAPEQTHGTNFIQGAFVTPGGATFIVMKSADERKAKLFLLRPGENTAYELSARVVVNRIGADDRIKDYLADISTDVDPKDNESALAYERNVPTPSKGMLTRSRSLHKVIREASSEELAALIARHRSADITYVGLPDVRKILRAFHSSGMNEFFVLNADVNVGAKESVHLFKGPLGRLSELPITDIFKGERMVRVVTPQGTLRYNLAMPMTGMWEMERTKAGLAVVETTHMTKMIGESRYPLTGAKPYAPAQG